MIVEVVGFLWFAEDDWFVPLMNVVPIDIGFNIISYCRYQPHGSWLEIPRPLTAAHQPLLLNVESFPNSTRHKSNNLRSINMIEHWWVQLFNTSSCQFVALSFLYKAAELSTLPLALATNSCARCVALWNVNLPICTQYSVRNERSVIKVYSIY